MLAGLCGPVVGETGTCSRQEVEPRGEVAIIASHPATWLIRVNVCLCVCAFAIVAAKCVCC